MYTDLEFGTVNIMLATLQRNLFPSYDNPERDNYMIGEIKPSALLDPKVISVGVSYLFHELKYKTNIAGYAVSGHIFFGLRKAKRVIDQNYKLYP